MALLFFWDRATPEEFLADEFDLVAAIAILALLLIIYDVVTLGLLFINFESLSFFSEIRSRSFDYSLWYQKPMSVSTPIETRYGKYILII